MRKVLKSHQEVCHFWANKVQSEGRLGNIFFVGDRIYSYGHHYCMARFLSDGKTVAFSNHDYSPTTNGHLSMARRALPGHYKIIKVFDPDGYPDKSRVERQVKGLLEKAAKARIRRASYLAEAHKLIEDFNTYCKIEDYKYKIKQIDVEGFSPEKLKAQIAADEQAKKRAEVRRQKQAEKGAKEEIGQWRRHELSYMRYNVRDLLRLAKDHTVVQTSRSAEIPVEAAVQLWPVIQRVMRGDKDYEVGMQLGNYRLTKIRRDGSIVVGCHDIAFSEIEGIAHELGLTNTSEAQRAFDGVAI